MAEQKKFTAKNEQNRCNAAKCDHLFTVTNYVNPKLHSHPRYVGIENIDEQHMCDHHLWYWLNFLTQDRLRLTDENKRLREENKRVRGEVANKPKDKLPHENKRVQDDKRSKLDSTANEELEVDPINLVPGICSALFRNGNVILKCTEHCKYKANVCIAHIGCKDLITVRDKTA